MLVCTIKLSESALSLSLHTHTHTHTHTPLRFWISYPFRSPQSIEFPVICNQFSVVIYFIHSINSAYMSIPVFFINSLRGLQKMGSGRKLPPSYSWAYYIEIPFTVLSKAFLTFRHLQTGLSISEVRLQYQCSCKTLSFRKCKSFSLNNCSTLVNQSPNRKQRCESFLLSDNTSL